MADSTNVVGQFKEEVAEVVRDVGGEVTDQLQQAAEQGIQSIMGTQAPLTSPQLQEEAAQKQVEDQQNLAKTRRIIKWHKDISDAQNKVREQEKQKEMQRLSGDKGSGEEQQKGKDVFVQIQERQKALAPTPVSNIENKGKMPA